MVKYSKVDCKLTNVQLNKLKKLLNLMKELMFKTITCTYKR